MALDTSGGILAAAARVGASSALLADAGFVCWASGMPVPIESGASPFAGGPTLAAVAADGRVGIVVINAERSIADRCPADLIIDYVGFSATEPVSLLTAYRDAARKLIEQLGLDGSVAVDHALPQSLADVLTSAGILIVDADDSFQRARAIKTPREIGLLRSSAAVATAGQKAARNARAGMTELELFADIRLAMESAAGERIAVTGDLLTGAQRTAGVLGWPSNRSLLAGDLVITDLAPRVNGYWADSCNTLQLGGASPETLLMHRSVRDALMAAADATKPGIAVNQIDAIARGRLAKNGFAYPHHTGHGIGTSVHEYPRIIPGETARLEAGMVILLEPAAYVPGVGGVRLEWMFEVTNDGCIPLTDFDLESLEVHQ